MTIMILPTESSHDVSAWRRQLLLDIGSISSITPTSSAVSSSANTANQTPTGVTVPTADLLNAPKNAPLAEKSTTSGLKPTPTDTSEEDEGPNTITLNSKIPKATNSASDKEEGIVLSRAVANSNLSWWQLICVAIAGIMCIGVAIWVIYRQKRKKKEDEDRKKEVEALEKEMKGVEEGKAKIIEIEGDKGKKKDDGESSDWDSEDYDSFSDGGTIRPGRRRKGGVRRDRYRLGRRRERERRDRGRGYYSSDESDYSYRDRDQPRRSRRRRPPSPSPSPTPRLPDPKNGRRKSFRDSVFSTYQSMKSAAVRLKQAEMTEKLKQALEDEERIEKARQMKVREANEEIKRFDLEKEREKIRGEVEAELRGKKRVESSDSRRSFFLETYAANRIERPLIPSVLRPPSRSSTAGSTSTGRHRPSRQTSYPLPTPRRNNSAQIPQIPPVARVRMPARGQTVDTIFQPPTGIGTDIHALLGTKPKPSLLPNKGIMGMSETQSVAVKPTKDRPTIPKGGLAPAPQGKKKGGLTPLFDARVDLGGGGGLEIPISKDLDHGWPTSRPGLDRAGMSLGKGYSVERPEVNRMGTSIGGNSLRSTGGGGGGSKWADRMRARK